MGRRQIETTAKRTIQTCDLCDRDMGGIAANKCDICGREACCGCSTLRLAYDTRNPGRIDLGVRVCRDCELAGREEPTSPMEVIQAAVKEADKQVCGALGVWRQASAAWLAKKKEG